MYAIIDVMCIMSHHDIDGCVGGETLYVMSMGLVALRCV